MSGSGVGVQSKAHFPVTYFIQGGSSSTASKTSQNNATTEHKLHHIPPPKTQESLQKIGHKEYKIQRLRMAVAKQIPQNTA